ncbi:TIGR04222 domain-containing membrane protein [Streptacidiphilus anmyonensis]|uniref:TIGR04222 domain-containing membrane protein n=1 Tax=Streptacidiphilus anmyonensis TaxID=405782 RepID=UPI0005A76EA7|nr:TIGR04222 domain-containing membrane protein [Streptacidiphilus anmyonensis]
MPYLFLVPAVLLAALSSLRLCRLAAASDPLPGLGPEALLLPPGASAPSTPSESFLRELRPSAPRPPAPVEAAYLAGGPRRVVDVTLIDMTGRGLLHLAHTGWTSVARPLPDTELESEVLAALGPEGQRRTDEVRGEVAAGPAVAALARSLADLGLAVPPGARAALAEAVAGVRFAFLATLGLGATALALIGARDLVSGAHEGLLTPAAWFVLPLVLTGGTLLMARAEFAPVTPWAAPAGQELLHALRPRRRALHHAADPLSAVVLRGPAAIRDPRLRAALTVRPRTRQGRGETPRP